MERGDPKLKELGLISNQTEVAKTMYDSAALVAVTQLRRIPHGDTIEEDHERDRQLIAGYIADKVPDRSSVTLATARYTFASLTTKDASRRWLAAGRTHAYQG